jgi:hypothetical protein
MAAPLNRYVLPRDAADALLAAILGRRGPASVLGHRKVRFFMRWLWL